MELMHEKLYSGGPPTLPAPWKLNGFLMTCSWYEELFVYQVQQPLNSQTVSLPSRQQASWQHSLRALVWILWIIFADTADSSVCVGKGLHKGT